ncbi:AMP-dependent synthetase and ligase [Parvibaculum lavamentivorans DS-1]|uniref:3-methylmercaptopropionyl-CoA ligase n=1 Tax=Parvibaculum lavamentivorans (strain DS-1 / DSM 13023 / NCIMB 13966) TaxID=402881 RepID=A7HR94_PARL1|nr:acyl-CoA synthetase [Parvibaculum lavamentivorans]ABS62427.1 AMP-dependent synthetase and ligase [Parvibaculum lavamentivorans DS-1]
MGAAAVRSGKRVAEISGLAERAARAASGFASLGIGAGDVVAVYLRNDFPFFEASAAAGLVGAYSTPVNWHNSPDEARYIFENSGAKAIVIHADLWRGIEKALPKNVPVFVVETPAEIVSAYGLSAEAAKLPAGTQDWGQWLAQFPPITAGPAEAPGSMIYTSGTTGHPKGVRRAAPTAEQAAAWGQVVGTVMGFSPEYGEPQNMVTVVTGPMYHSAPNAYGLFAFRVGANVILQPRFDPEELLQMIDTYKVTHLHMVPTMFVRLLKLPDEVKKKYDLSSLRFVVHAAAPCPVHVKQAMIAWWGPVINEYYGGTETGAVVFCNSEQYLKHPGTVGKAVQGAKVMVLGENGEELAAGATGEIVCRIPAIPDFTYHGDDEKRRKAEKAGLIALGDIGYLDEDGFLYLCDRAKDMVISGGVNIYPAEIEAELHKMPGVGDCAVFGIPDEEFGESLCAVVQQQPGAGLSEADVKAFLRERVAGYKVPKRVEFQNDLPREDSGKIFKRKLREPYWQQAGRQI